MTTLLTGSFLSTNSSIISSSFCIETMSDSNLRNMLVVFWFSLEKNTPSSQLSKNWLTRLYDEINVSKDHRSSLKVPVAAAHKRGSVIHVKLGVWQTKIALICQGERPDVEFPQHRVPLLLWETSLRLVKALSYPNHRIRPLIEHPHADIQAIDS